MPRPLDGLLLPLRGRPLGILKVVEGLGEAVLEPLVLQPPLPVVRHRGRRAQLAQVPRRVLRQLAGVVLHLVAEKDSKKNIEVEFIN